MKCYIIIYIYSLVKYKKILLVIYVDVLVLTYVRHKVRLIQGVL